MSWQDDLQRCALHWPDEPVNTNLFKYAQQLSCQGHSPDVVFLMLLPLGRAYGKSDAEIKECAQNGCKYRDQLKNNEPKPLRYRYLGRARPRVEPQPATPTDLPAPIIPGWQALLAAAFEPGELIRLVNSTKIGDAWRPAGQGIIKTVEELSQCQPEELITGAGGGYISINPCTGPTNQDVTAFRHMLLEWDTLPIEEQWQLIQTSRLPVTAVIHTGGKSLHAWVRLDAISVEDYAAKAQKVLAYFKTHPPDASTKNPARMSRIPDVQRHNCYQRLIILNIGEKTFDDWEKLTSDPLPIAHNLVQLANTNWANDPDNILGNRWLCRARAALLIGQSGTGKSTLAMFAGLQWCAGRDFFGITPHQPRKVLYIQAENDAGDLGEILQGLIRANVMDIEMFNLACKNFTLITETSATGTRFLERLERLLSEYHSDIVIVDPLMAYAGCNLSSAEDTQQFLRNGIGHILENAPSRPAAIFVHHTPKPTKDPKSGSHHTESDFQYDGFGSSDMVNWARAVLTLRRVKTDDDLSLFRLIAPKRGSRAGLTDYDGLKSTSIYISHHPTCQAWQLSPPPEDAENSSHRAPAHRPKKDWSALQHALPLTRSDLLKWLEGQGYSPDSAKRILRRLLQTNIIKTDKDISNIYVKP